MKASAVALTSLTLTACAASGDMSIEIVGVTQPVVDSGTTPERDFSIPRPRRLDVVPDDAGRPTDAAPVADAAVAPPPPTVDAASPPSPPPPPSPPSCGATCVGVALREGGHVNVPGGVPSRLGGVDSPKMFEAWVRPDATGNVGLFNVGTGTPCGNASCGGGHFTLNVASGFLSVDVGQGVGQTTVAIPPSTWTFVFAGYDPSTGYFAGKVDSGGVAVRQRVAISNGITTSVLYPGTTTTLGRDQNAQYLTGILGGLRAWNRVLTDAEVVARHKVRLSPTEPGLVAQWWMEEGTGSTTLDDVSGGAAVLTGAATWTTYPCP